MATQRSNVVTSASRATSHYRGNDGMDNFSWIDTPTVGTPSVPVTDTPFLGSNLVLQWMEGVKRYGWQRCIVQAYTVFQKL